MVPKKKGGYEEASVPQEQGEDLGRFILVSPRIRFSFSKAEAGCSRRMNLRNQISNQ